MRRDRAEAISLMYALPLTPLGKPGRPDYYELHQNVRDRITTAADDLAFVKPANSNAPRDVYFYGKLGRALAKPE